MLTQNTEVAVYQPRHDIDTLPIRGAAVSALMKVAVRTLRNQFMDAAGFEVHRIGRHRACGCSSVAGHRPGCQALHRELGIAR